MLLTRGLRVGNRCILIRVPCPIARSPGGVLELFALRQSLLTFASSKDHFFQITLSCWTICSRNVQIETLDASHSSAFVPPAPYSPISPMEWPMELPCWNR